MGILKIQILMEMTIADELAMLPDDVKYELQLLNTLYPNPVAPGSVVDEPTKLIYACITTDTIDPLTLLESMIISYELDWTIHSMQSNREVVHIVEGEEIIATTPVIYKELDMATVDKFISDDLIPKTASMLTYYQGLNRWV